ncbi:hypothetical protein [Bradyrhizobium sp. CCBAU 051011]|uniref:hypothetical protein n=1 Tax=Bradyrhizobium sp. CCBAU 051011 TaxID=858422 RepID=UPI001AEDA203|nr:hypothetical protein [Bradyrhizobium sp. CCBAU 051011]
MILGLGHEDQLIPVERDELFFLGPRYLVIDTDIEKARAVADAEPTVTRLLGFLGIVFRAVAFGRGREALGQFPLLREAPKELIRKRHLAQRGCIHPVVVGVEVDLASLCEQRNRSLRHEIRPVFLPIAPIDDLRPAMTIHSRRRWRRRANEALPGLFINVSEPFTNLAILLQSTRLPLA